MNPVSAILVNYKSPEDTCRCVASLVSQQPKIESIYIVDNASTSESRNILENLKTTSPDARIHFIFNEMNVGFAIACNQAMKQLQSNGFCGYFWLVNNDTIARAGALNNLLQKAEKEKAGITGSKIILCGNKEGGIARIHPFWGSVKRMHQFENTKYDYIEGASILISPECFQKIGFLPEDYFLYFEETDYCFKARQAGIKLAWASDSIIEHNAGNSTVREIGKGKAPFFIDCLMIRNRVLFSRRYHISNIGIAMAFLISILLRIKRGQWKRVFTISKIILNKKYFVSFIENNGGHL